MALHFDTSRGPRFLQLLLHPRQAHIDRALMVVLGIIGISLLLGALQVIDVAVSGALRDLRTPRQLSLGPVSGSPDRSGLESGAEDAAARNCSFVEMPSGSVDAINL